MANVKLYQGVAMEGLDIVDAASGHTAWMGFVQSRPNTGNHLNGQAEASASSSPHEKRTLVFARRSSTTNIKQDDVSWKDTFHPFIGNITWQGIQSSGRFWDPKQDMSAICVPHGFHEGE